MTSHRRAAPRGWGGRQASLLAPLIGACALALVAVCSPPAQAAPPARQTLAAASRALVEGRFEEFDQLTDKLDVRDPQVAALRAQAAIERGRYAQAETWLKPAAGREPAGEAALQLGLLQQMLGRSEAVATLLPVAASGDAAASATDLARAARALRALGRFEEANAAYRDAAGADAGDPALNTAWGELFLEKFNRADATRSFQAALQADPAWGPALVGMAEVLADDNPPQAAEYARKALARNPVSAPARLVLARQALDEGQRSAARELLRQMTAVNPSHLEARAWLAAIAYIEEDVPGFEAEATRLLAIAPRFGDAYRVAAEVAARHYRFDEAVTLARRAVAVNPDNSRALAELGTHLLRTGDEAGARQALEAAWKIDSYDLVTYNLLALLDTLDTFTTFRDRDLIFRVPESEAPVLREYAVTTARQALTSLSTRYGFAPRGPVLVEIFNRHDDFAVRIAGLPGMVGALGACFGRVVTMDSPKARPPGTFQWEATLWHELAHVITLQMSNQRVPRWLTEGLSVYEEKRARPEWGRDMDIEFAGLLEHGKVLKLRELNAAFTDPKTVGLAYYEASLLAEHLEATYGVAGIRRLLRAYGQGMDTDAAVAAALDSDLDRLQAGFDQALERLFGNLRRALAGPDDQELLQMPLASLRMLGNEQARSYPVQMALGRALRRAGEIDEAMAAFQRAAALVPMAAGADSPHAQMAAMSAQRKDTTRTILELQALMQADFNNVEAARQLITFMKQAGVDDPSKLRSVYQRIIAIDPFDGEAHAALGRLAMQRDDLDAAAREFRVALAIGPVDKAAAHTDLAESYFRSGRRADARKQTLAALEIAPTFERAQDLLLKIAEGPK